MTKDDMASNATTHGTAWVGYFLGFGLGGFFDGILLHQVLQWHHLLSEVEAANGDLRLLILWDGIFHLLMYLITGIGLWLLWRHRTAFKAAGAGRRLLGEALIGFGAWHTLDAFLSHWFLGIHRIRMDVDNPLAWDIGWLVIFGLIPAAFGWWMRTRLPPGSTSGPADEQGSGAGKLAGDGKVATLLVLLALLALTAAPIAALPANASATATLVLLKPGTTPQAAARGLTVSGARLVWSNAEDTVWAVELPEGADRLDLYRHGALAVSNSFLPAGCLNWFAAPS